MLPVFADERSNRPVDAVTSWSSLVWAASSAHPGAIIASADARTHQSKQAIHGSFSSAFSRAATRPFGAGRASNAPPRATQQRPRRRARARPGWIAGGSPWIDRRVVWAGPSQSRAATASERGRGIAPRRNHAPTTCTRGARASGWRRGQSHRRRRARPTSRARLSGSAAQPQARRSCASSASAKRSASASSRGCDLGEARPHADGPRALAPARPVEELAARSDVSRRMCQEPQLPSGGVAPVRQSASAKASPSPSIASAQPSAKRSPAEGLTQRIGARGGVLGEQRVDRAGLAIPRVVGVTPLHAAGVQRERLCLRVARAWVDVERGEPLHRFIVVASGRLERREA